MKLLIGGTPPPTLKHITPREYRDQCGMLTSWRDGANPLHAVRLGASWAMDNYCFVPERFEPDAFMAFMVKCAGLPNCLFVVSPDIPGNAVETLRLFDAWHDRIRALGYPVALAIQNGQESLPVPFRDIDAVFVGGDNAFKYSAFVSELVIEAHRKRVWCHMGRVNSRGRWRYCLDNGFDSVDGSGMVIERARVLEALNVLNTPERPQWDWRPHIHIGVLT